MTLLRRLLISMLPAASILAGCGERPDPLEPLPGALLLSVNAFGYPEAWRYRVTLNGEEVARIRTGETVSAPQPVEGTHSLAIEVPNGCAVLDVNPRAITIAPGETAVESFQVDCRGAIRFTTATDGVNPPPAYTLLLNDAAPVPVGANASIELGGLTARQYEIVLGGVTPNCIPLSGDRRSLYLVPRDTLTVAFQLDCRENAGSAEVTTVVTGNPLEEISLYFTGWVTLPLSGSIVIRGIPAGNWQPVILTGSDCEAEITEGYFYFPGWTVGVIQIFDREATRMTVTVSC